MLLCLAALAPARGAEDAQSAAREIARALAADRYPHAVQVWKERGEAILGDLPACLAAARAFLDFSRSDLAKRYREIPLECADAALACVEAANALVPEPARESLLAVAEGYLDVADLYAPRGRRDVASKARAGALAILEAVTAAGKAPGGAWEQLGRAHRALADSAPGSAEEHLVRAAAAYEKAAKSAGGSPVRCRTLGELRVRLARLLMARLAAAPKERGLEDSMKEAWDDALKAFEEGLKLAPGDRWLTTAYNECLWELEAVTKGKHRGRPIVSRRLLRHGRLQLSMPVSSRWQILGEADLSAWDEVFDALKEDRERGRTLRILIDQYWWKRSTKAPGSEEEVRGDDVDGLARRAEQVMRDYFDEVTKTIPKRGGARIGKFTEAVTFAMRGKVAGGASREYRSIFIKDPRVMFTYHITVIADPETVDRYPHELEYILSTVESKIVR